MNATASTRISYLFASAILVCSTSYAFQDDYVWQERFKKQSALAEQGNADAQYDVGEMYDKGSGVAIDAKKAFVWLEKSAAQGHVKAQFKVAYMYYKGQGVDGNVNKAYQLMEKPANDGNVRAQYYLAQMLANGDGVKPDPDEAFTWYSRSSLGGYKPADEALGELKRAMAEKSRKDDERIRKEEESSTKSLAKAPKPTGKTQSAKAETPMKTETPAALSSAPAAAQLASIEGMQPAMQTQPSTAGMLLNGTWMSLSKTPAEYLPSKITACHKTSDAIIECLSEELQRNVAGTEIVYQTKAIVYAMKKDGDFKIAYRNNVTKILSAKEGGEEQPSGTGDTAGIKLGWQETEHRMECKVDPEQNVNCVKNKTQKITLKNQTML